MTSRTTHSKRPFVIAEIALSHDGSLGMAHAFIDAAAQAGADAVKFQTHIAVAESTFDEPFRIAFSVRDGTSATTTGVARSSPPSSGRSWLLMPSVAGSPFSAHPSR